MYDQQTQATIEEVCDYVMCTTEISSSKRTCQGTTESDTKFGLSLI